MKLTKREAEYIDAFTKEAEKTLDLLGALEELGLVRDMFDVGTRKRAWPMIKRTAAEVAMDWASEDGRAWLRANWAARMARKDALDDRG